MVKSGFDRTHPSKINFELPAFKDNKLDKILVSTKKSDGYRKILIKDTPCAGNSNFITAFPSFMSCHFGELKSCNCPALSSSSY
jgi:hypothetical protein